MDLLRLGAGKAGEGTGTGATGSPAQGLGAQDGSQGAQTTPAVGSQNEQQAALESVPSGSSGGAVSMDQAVGGGDDSCRGNGSGSGGANVLQASTPYAVEEALAQQRVSEMGKWVLGRQ